MFYVRISFIMRGAYVNFETVKMTLDLDSMRKVILWLCNSELSFVEFHSIILNIGVSIDNFIIITYMIKL